MDALGIDLGTTFTAAAVASGDRVEVVTLGQRSPQIPSIVCLRDDGEVLVGEAAERRAPSDPARAAREFKRRLGDPMPILLGGTPYGAEALTAELLRHVLAHVGAERGSIPGRVVVAHPANYGPYKLDLLHEALRLAGIADAQLVTEPAAAAIHYLAQDTVDPGRAVAVYDFGGGTFDATVLRRTGTGWEVVGVPDGLERLGGIDFDQAVFGHVEATLGGAIAELDPADPAARQALAHLREACRDAKEALSTDTDTTIGVLLPNLHTEVRLTRAEFETLIRPRVAETVRALERAVTSANLADGELARVLLVGGTSRIPLCAQLLAETFDVPIAVDIQPKFAVCLGAARLGIDLPVAQPAPLSPSVPAWGTVATPPATATPVAPPAATPPDPPAPATTPAPRYFVPAPEAPPTDPPPPAAVPAAATAPPARRTAERSARRRPRALLVAVAVLLAAAGVAAALALGGSDDGPIVSEFRTENLGDGRCAAIFRFDERWQGRVDNVAILADRQLVDAGPPNFTGRFLYDARVDLTSILLEDGEGRVVETALPDPDDC